MTRTAGETWDVAVAGAGLAGASLALRLARRGARVVLLDASAFPRPKLCGEFLSPEAWRPLEDLGLAPAIAASGFEPILRARLSTPAGRILEAPLPGYAGRPGIALGRATLDALLVEQARHAGATLIERARVTGPIVEEGRVVGLTARTADEGPLPFRARVTVAADGRHSALVRHTGATRGRSWLRVPSFGLKRHIQVDDPAAAEPPGTVALHLVAGGYVGSCRIEGGLTNVCGLLPEALIRQYRGDLDRLAATEFARNPALGRLHSAATPVGPWKTVSGVRVERSTPRLDGILYAGDCQGTVDPLGGQGMTMALLGVEPLAEAVLEALAAGAADRSLQERTERAWQARFGRRITLCRAFHHVLCNPRLIDLGCWWPAVGARLLSAGFTLTREPAAT